MVAATLPSLSSSSGLTPAATSSSCISVCECTDTTGQQCRITDEGAPQREHMAIVIMATQWSVANLANHTKLAAIKTYLLILICPPQRTAPISCAHVDH